MRYGGHQTFTIREGWLTKAIALLIEDPIAYFDKVDLANALGVGVNMGKSIEHWLLATKLVTRIPLRTAREVGIKYELTKLGQIIYANDPFMTLEETWWLLHLNMVQNPDYAATWDWFFNEFSDQKFDKARLIQKILVREKEVSKRVPAQSTIERDVSCFLNTYAQPIPREVKDPEEDYACPLLDLQLMTYQKNSGTYEQNRRYRNFPPELLLYSFNSILGNGKQSYDLTLSWLNKQRSGPLQAFNLSSEGLFELVIQSERVAAKKYGYSVRSLAGDRQIVYTNPGDSVLLQAMYEGLK